MNECEISYMLVRELPGENENIFEEYRCGRKVSGAVCHWQYLKLAATVTIQIPIQAR